MPWTSPFLCWFKSVWRFHTFVVVVVYDRTSLIALGMCVWLALIQACIAFPPLGNPFDFSSSAHHHQTPHALLYISLAVVQKCLESSNTSCQCHNKSYGACSTSDDLISILDLSAERVEWIECNVVSCRGMFMYKIIFYLLFEHIKYLWYSTREIHITKIHLPIYSPP